MQPVDSDSRDALRRLPSVDLLLREPALVGLPRRAVAREARKLLHELRDEIAGDGVTEESLSGVTETLADRVRSSCAMHHRRVVNATGVVLHTGIGRAPLADAARAAVAEAAGYALVEVDSLTGERNEREECVARLIAEVSGAEAALVVNNNAGAVNLVLRALAMDGEVVVSRGELVEIGGGFRMPDVMAQAGCTMVEVGTTNRTHLRDFAAVIHGHTRMLVKIHPSNFRIVGFTSTPGLAELVELGREHDVRVFEDLGSGLLAEDVPPALSREPRVVESVRAGAALVCFSGDKLLGGPQCGIIVGSADAVREVRSHPLYRAFRCDKLTLAALEATVRIYRDGDPLRDVPTLRSIARDTEDLAPMAQSLAERLSRFGSTVVASESFVGSGANPARPIPSLAVALPGAARVVDRLRTHAEVPVFARAGDGQALLDLRTLADEDLDEVVRLVTGAL